MKVRSVILLVSLLFFGPILNGQSLEGDYMKVDYLKVESQQEDEFLGQIKTNWKQLQETRIESSEISGWLLYKVIFPGSWDNEYNYVSVTSARSMSAFEAADGFLSENEASSDRRLRAALRPVRTIIHSELWSVRNSVTKQSDYTPSRYMIMDYMAVPLGREYEYQMFEDEIARPLHEDRMEMDRMNAWEVYELIIPGGMNYGYNFSTGNFYTNLEHIEFGFTDELIRANHPDVNLMEFFETIFSTRDLIKSEMWELVDYLH